MSAHKRFTLIPALLALAGVSYLDFHFADERTDVTDSHAVTRMPVANPPVDPNRPDLLEEPRIDDQS